MSETRPIAAAPPGPEERWLWLLFLAAWVLHAHYALIGWDHTVLGAMQFRQAQTALAAAYFPVDGFPLAYELPLFGPPWSLPLEFPLYQASVAWFSHLTGLALEPAGRAVSWIYFQAGLPALFLLLGPAGVPRPQRWITLALLVTSPMYIYYSRSFLIESLAWSAGMWFLAAFTRLLSRPAIGWYIACAVGGAISATVKVTTWGVFALAAALIVVLRMWPLRARGAAGLVRACWPAALAVAPALVAGLAWTWYAKSVRDLNPEVGFLNSHFGAWTFGTLGQRFGWEFWRRILEVWMTGIVGDAGLAVAVVLFARAGATWRRLSLLAFAAFLSGPLVFANLYFVHDYYFYASGAFLVVAVGLLATSLFSDPQSPPWLRCGVPVMLVLLQLATYGRSYHTFQAEHRRVPEYVQALRDLTDPDQVVVVLGKDWDAATALYSGRRAFMLLAGAEKDPAGVRQSLARLGLHRVGAVLLSGEFHANPELARDAFGALELGPAPLFASAGEKVGIWIPRTRLASVLETLPSRPYVTLEFNPPPSPADGTVTLGPREIAARREFHLMSPRPVRATGSAGFSYATVGLVRVLNAHAPFELEFRVPAGAKHVRLSFGIHDGAYADPHQRTDGVTFELIQVDDYGRRHVLRSIHLDPHGTPAHRGPQDLALPLAAEGGLLLLRATAGPAGNASFDWAYVGRLELD